MYIPRHFDEPRLDVNHQTIQANPFATMVSNGPAGLEATHLPFLLDPGRGALGTLRGHIARANPQWRDFDREVLVMFQGPHAYISPSWYGPGDSVPTWNYLAVHAYGTPSVVDDPTEALALLTELAATFEAPLERPWTPQHLSPKYLNSMTRAIVAFEIPIARLEGKAKMSQNRPADQSRVAAILEGAGAETDRAVAAEIRARSDNAESIA
jgi:transcriptional regulator